MSKNLITYIPDDPSAKVITQNFRNLVEIDLSHNMIASQNAIMAAEKFQSL